MRSFPTGLPPGMKGKRWYEPTDRGVEKRVQERLNEIRRLRSGEPD